jgi:hypothetical protein
LWSILRTLVWLAVALGSVVFGALEASHLFPRLPWAQEYLRFPDNNEELVWKVAFGVVLPVLALVEYVSVSTRLGGEHRSAGEFSSFLLGAICWRDPLVPHDGDAVARFLWWVLVGLCTTLPMWVVKKLAAFEGVWTWVFRQDEALGEMEGEVESAGVGATLQVEGANDEFAVEG